MKIPRPEAMVVTLIVVLTLATGCRNPDLYDYDGDGVVNADDCEPEDPEVYPGAGEDCGDGTDNDCDGDVDLDDTDCQHDRDEDGWDEEQGDCNDHDATVNPGADEVICDGVDNDCSELTADDPDEDEDGFTFCTDDCDDQDPQANPGMEEICGDGVDNDCDGGPNDCGWYGDFALAEAAVAKLLGEEDWNGAGTAVAWAGDLDDDGAPDLLIGAPVYYTRGRAYVVSGPVAGTHDLSTAEATITADAKNTWLGGALAGVGDTDGDGRDDVLIAAHGADEKAENAGAAYLFLGPVLGTLDAGDADAVLLGPEAGAEAGRSVAGVGDLDGDGRDDLIVGAPLFDGGRGAVFVVHGPVAGPVELAAVPDRIVGLEASHGAGDSACGAGDLDGDGTPDLLVGTPYHMTGTVHVVPGPVVGEVALEDAAAQIQWGGGELGGTMASLGDMDGDLRDEILIGSGATKDLPGGAFVLHGPVLGQHDLPMDAEAHLLPTPEGERELPLDGAGDVDGDGYRDAVVGAPGDIWTMDTPGVVYLAYGPLSGELALDQAGASFVGEAPDDRAGASVAGGFDLDGDGYDDLLIGAPDQDEAEENAGAVYVVRGGPGL